MDRSGGIRAGVDRLVRLLMRGPLGALGAAFAMSVFPIGWRRESDYDAADDRFLARGSTRRFKMTKLIFRKPPPSWWRIGRRGTKAASI
jgi:hypothetical protein